MYARRNLLADTNAQSHANRFGRCLLPYFYCYYLLLVVKPCHHLPPTLFCLSPTMVIFKPTNGSFKPTNGIFKPIMASLSQHCSSLFSGSIAHGFSLIFAKVTFLIYRTSHYVQKNTKKVIFLKVKEFLKVKR